MVVRSVQESGKLSIRYRRAINIKTMNVHSLPMETACRIFPGILHIRSGIVAALDLNAARLKVEVTAGNPHHSIRHRWSRAGSRYFNQSLRHGFPFPRIAGKRALGTFRHVSEQVLKTRVHFLFRGENRSVTEAFEVEAQGGFAVGQDGRQFGPVPKVVEVHAWPACDLDLRTGDVVFVTVDDRP